MPVEFFEAAQQGHLVKLQAIVRIPLIIQWLQTGNLDAIDSRAGKLDSPFGPLQTLGFTALHYAAAGRHWALLQFLVSSAIPYTKSSSKRSRYSQTLLDSLHCTTAVKNLDW